MIRGAAVFSPRLLTSHSSLCLSSCSAPPGPGRPCLPPTRTAIGAEVYRRTLRGVAWVHSPDAGKGTGWILDRSRRLLVTCAHVVGDNTTVDVVFPVREGGAVVADRGYYFEHMPDLRKSGTAVRGRVLKRNPAVDLALVELESLPDGVERIAPGRRRRPARRPRSRRRLPLRRRFAVGAIPAAQCARCRR